MTLVDGFSHLVVQVTDLDRSEKFYQEVLGLDLVGRDLVAEDGPHSLLRMNTGQFLLLLQAAEVAPFRPNSSSIHHAWLLTIEQYKRAQQRLKAIGVNIEDSRESFRALGEFSMDVYDPDGHRYQVQAFSPEVRKIIKPSVGKVTCGKTEDFALGSVTPFNQGNFFLVRLNEGFLALSRWCTHKNGQIRWEKEHWRFYCPFHGATYNRTGESTGHISDVGPLRLNPVTITEGGGVVVDTGVVIIRQGYHPDQLVPAECGAEFCAAGVERV